MADQDNSLRDDIMAAADEIEPEEVTTDEIEEAAAPQAAQETQEEVPEQELAGDEPAGEPSADEPPSDVAASKPPVDWAPEVKEQWSKLDPAVQSAIADRERHINETLQHTAEARHAVESFNQMFQPYIPLMQAEGVSDPMVAINGLLQTTAALSMGSPAQKAQRIAGLIEHYGVDIATLDQVLSGGQAADPSETRLEQLLDQRLAPVNQLIERANQADYQQRAQIDAEVSNDIAAFAADAQNVHFEAVRGVMADFMDMAAHNGQAMSIQDAYKRACLADPRIAPLVTQQFAQEAAQGQQGMLAGKRNAASSITGHPAAGANTGLDAGMSIRETLEAQLGGSDRI